MNARRGVTASAGGGCIISVRDYETEERGRGLVKPYGVRTTNGFRYLLFQVWDFDGEHYDFTFYIIEENNSTQKTRTHAQISGQIHSVWLFP